MSIDLTLEGIVDEIKDPIEYGKDGNTLRKVVIWIEHDNGFEDLFEITFFKDKGDMLDKFKEDQEVRVRCSLNGREITTKKGNKMIIHGLTGWSIKDANDPETTPRKRNKRETTKRGRFKTNKEDMPNDNMPF